MTVVHTVLFQFKPYASSEEVKAVRTEPTYRGSTQSICANVVPKAVDRFLALKESCVHPTSNSPYIKSLKGGKDNSPEGLQVGILPIL